MPRYCIKKQQKSGIQISPITIIITFCLLSLSSCNVSPFDHTAANLVLKQKTPALFLLTISSSDSSLLYTFHQAAQLFYAMYPHHFPQHKINPSQRLLFIVSNPNDGLYTYEKITQILGVQKEGKAGIDVMIYLQQGKNKYRYIEVEDKNNKISKEDVIKFIQQVKSKRLQKFYKSQQLQEVELNNKSKYVKKLVGKNYNQQVLSSRKQHFILFYFSYDYKSRTLLSKFHKTAQSLRKNPNIIFKKINLQRNQIPPAPQPHPNPFVAQKQIPFILFYGIDKSKQPIQFTKIQFAKYQQSQDYMIKWLKQTTKYQWVRSQQINQMAYDDL